MRHTLKAVFAHRSDAQHVLNELLASGYSQADTALSSEFPTAHVRGPVKRLAARLLGSGQPKPGMADPGAFARERHVVTLAADSEPDVARAVAIIERFGPLDIDDHDNDEWDHGSVDAGTDAVGRKPVYPPGTEPGALQSRVLEDSRYFGTQRADSPPTGNTFQETMGADSQWVRPDDGRLHVPATASWPDSDSAVPDDRIEAYLYGSAARRSEKYRSRDWQDVEPELEAGWKARHAAQLSSWGNFKDAVNHGWNRVRPDMDDASHAAVDAIGDDDRSAAHRHDADAASTSPAWDKVKAAIRHGWDRVSS